MGTLQGFPYFEVQFGKDGKPVDGAEVEAVQSYLAGNPASDVIVISHGWNNNIAEARTLYEHFFARVRTVLDAGRVALDGRSLAVVGLFWPSKRFTERKHIPGGAASLGGAPGTEALAAQLDELQGVFDDPDADTKLAEAKTLLPQLEFNPAAQKRFADLIRSVLPRDETDPEEDASSQFFSTAGDTLIERLGRPVLPAPPSGPSGSSGGAAGGLGGIGGGRAAGGMSGSPAASLGGFLSGVRAGAERLLNYATYWQMKNRAGVIGQGGVNDLLRGMRDAHPDLRLHLVGHSFGARLVTAATLGPAGATPIRPATLTLLQPAFSHYGFAQRYDGAHDGFFRAVVGGGMVGGPILVTCSAHDEAVGILYPLASLVAGQVAAALGDKNDLYGGMGRNGAQKTPEASDGTLLPVGGAYAFVAGPVYNLVGDAVIQDHGDIARDEVAYALLRSVAVT